MKFFSMFTGVGGFELGLEGHECIGYSEIEKNCNIVLEQKFKGVKNYGDATKINPEELPDFDIICGGFPCQSFSIAGKRGGFNDTRGTLFFEVARIIKVKRPTFVFLENVKGLLSHDNGKTFSVIITSLNNLGYYVDYRILNSKYFGVPQNRERIFIIGVNIKCLKEFVEDGQKEKTILLEKIIKPYLLEILLKIYNGVKNPQDIDFDDLDLDSVLLKEMIANGLIKNYPYLKEILKNLIPKYQEYLHIEQYQQSVTKEENWKLQNQDHIGKALLMDTMLDEMEKEEKSLNIEKLLKESLEESSNQPKEFITLMVKKMITDEKIYTSAEMKVITNLFIVVWKELLIDWWKMVSLNLIIKEVNINDKDMQFLMGNEEDRKKCSIISSIRGEPRQEILPFTENAGTIQDILEIKKLGCINEYQSDIVYNPEGISGTLMSQAGGNSKGSQLIIDDKKKSTILSPINFQFEKGNEDTRKRIETDTVPALCVRQQLTGLPLVMEKYDTKDSKPEIGQAMRRYGTAGISPPLNNWSPIVEPKIKILGNIQPTPYQSGNIYDITGVSACLQKANAVAGHDSFGGVPKILIENRNTNEIIEKDTIMPTLTGGGSGRNGGYNSKILCKDEKEIITISNLSKDGDYAGCDVVDTTDISKSIIDGHGVGIPKIYTFRAFDGSSKEDGRAIREHQTEDEIPALTSQMGMGGNNVPMLISSPREHGVIMDDCSQCLLKGEIPTLLLATNTEKGYVEAESGDGIRLQYPESETSKGRVQKGTSPALQCGGMSGTNDAGQLRRLTPVECERLQGFPDNWTNVPIPKGMMSDSQRYKMMGNAVTVNVIKAISKKLTHIEVIKELTKEEIESVMKEYRKIYPKQKKINDFMK